MDIKIEDHQNGSRVRLAGEFTIYSVTRIMSQLLDLIHKSPALEVDLADVCEFDTAGLQLLALIKREAESSNTLIHFSNHSGSVLEVLNLCDLSEKFDAINTVE